MTSYGKILKSEIDLITNLIGFTEEELEEFKSELWAYAKAYNEEIIEKYGEEKAKEFTIKLRNVIKSCHNNKAPFTDKQKAILLETYTVPEVLINRIDHILSKSYD